MDIIPVQITGCNPITSGQISYQYTITVTVTVEDVPPVPPTAIFNITDTYCAGETTDVLPNMSDNGLTLGTWSPTVIQQHDQRHTHGHPPLMNVLRLTYCL
ncbi:MAG: hypothetical protein R2795_22755 [Saprospiraceae bacterium]